MWQISPPGSSTFALGLTGLLGEQHAGEDPLARLWVHLRLEGEERLRLVLRQPEGLQLQGREGHGQEEQPEDKGTGSHVPDTSADAAPHCAAIKNLMSCSSVSQAQPTPCRCDGLGYASSSTEWEGHSRSLPSPAFSRNPQRSGAGRHCDAPLTGSQRHQRRAAPLLGRSQPGSVIAGSPANTGHSDCSSRRSVGGGTDYRRSRRRT